MKNFPNNAVPSRSGMTLMEVVIAIGVVAFVVPLILAATGSAGNSRQNAEADTRSAWIAREVRQELILSWGDHPSESIFEEAMDFPNLANEDKPEMLLFDSNGGFLQKGSEADFTAPSQVKGAAYIVAIHAEEHTPPNLTTTGSPLSLLRIRILHPAKATPGNRSTYRYNLITTRQGTP